MPKPDIYPPNIIFEKSLNHNTYKINSNLIVVMVDGNISCASSRSDCSENYERGAVVTLSANAADLASIFTGWSGACSGTGTCQITMGDDQSVTAVFSKRAVTLTAVADPGSKFDKWTGECLAKEQCFTSSSDSCVGGAKCNITMGSNQSVTANFVRNTNIEDEEPNINTNPAVGGGCSGDDWTCSLWSPAECPLSGVQTRTCVRNCSNPADPSPATSQTCVTQLNPGKIYEVRP